MTRYVPLEKRSKKAQKAYHAASRGSWGEIRPVTRRVESRKAFSKSRRSRAKASLRKMDY